MYVWDKTVQPAQDQQWNFTVQDAVTSTTTVQIGYVGQHGTHLMVPTPYLQKQLINGQPEPELYFQGNPTLLADISTGVRNRFDGLHDTTTHFKLSCSNAFRNGLEGQVAYTWSHCLTNNSGYYGTWGSATQATPAIAVLPEPLQPWRRLRQLLLRRAKATCPPTLLTICLLAEVRSSAAI